MLRRLVAFVLLALWPVLAQGFQPPVNTAGIYIDFGDGTTTMVLVPFEEDEITGIELIERSTLPLLTVGFGGLGNAVCTIQQTGCEVSACRRTLCQDGDGESPFWQYLQLADDGTWVTSPLGPGASTVQDGDIDAWVWSGTPPELPSLTIADIERETGAPQGLEPAIASIGGELPGDDEDATRQWLVGGVMVAIAVVIGVALGITAKRNR